MAMGCKLVLAWLTPKLWLAVQSTAMGQKPAGLSPKLWLAVRIVAMGLKKKKRHDLCQVLGSCSIRIGIAGLPLSGRRLCCQHHV
jgi:hypothetical protein